MSAIYLGIYRYFSLLWKIVFLGLCVSTFVIIYPHRVYLLAWRVNKTTKQETLYRQTRSNLWWAVAHMSYHRSSCPLVRTHAYTINRNWHNTKLKITVHVLCYQICLSPLIKSWRDFFALRCCPLGMPPKVVLSPLSFGQTSQTVSSFSTEQSALKRYATFVKVSLHQLPTYVT